MPLDDMHHPLAAGFELLEGAAAVIRDRADAYGVPEGVFAHIAERWSLVLGIHVTLPQVILCLADLKIARLTQNSNDRDSLADLAGYAACLAVVNAPARLPRPPSSDA